ncbi:MAG: DUF3788 domain-containing protein [Defluviitaleaceae bacterium]|nr:DUF3788 domain-containing protein [Defluviitaleaceae bacterium]
MHEKLQLRDQVITPTNPQLEQILGESYKAYEALQNTLPELEIEQEWQWYTPSKVWAGRGQHRWTTPRGTSKEKTLYWLHVFEGWFSVAVWFKEKNREIILQADVSEKTKELIRGSSTYGKLPTFPVEFKVATDEPIADICVLIDSKKRLEK